MTPVSSQSGVMTSLDEPMLPSSYEVIKRWDETRDVFTFELRPRPQSGDAVQDEPRQALAYRPGQFNMLYAWGVGEVPISVSGDPADRTRLVHTIRKVGAVTEALAMLEERAIVGVRGPFGTGWPLDSARGKDVVVAAGGLGLAPLRPALYQLLAERKDFGRLSLVYGARNPSDLLFTEELARWKASGNIDVQIAVDAATPEWRGNVGHVTVLIKRIRFAPANTLVLLCGPEVMMRFMALELVKQGVPPEAIHLSMERNMKCAVRLCGHCQYREHFVCADGPVYSYARLESLLRQREI